MFEPTSRYFRVREARYETPDGRRVVYKRRRLLPRREASPTAAQVTIFDGDRLDLIAARTLGDSELFWRICDANDAMNPFELTERAGGSLRLPGPSVAGQP